jgi:uncharacterized protein DUF6570
MHLDSDGICKRCRDKDRGKDFHLFGIDNNMFPGDMPDLPELTQIEEMLIARVHVFIESGGCVVNSTSTKAT